MSRLEKAIAAARGALDNEAQTAEIDAVRLDGAIRELIAAIDAGRDDSPIDIGGECVPRWIVEYANALTTYFAERGGRSWAIGGVQSRDQAPPAAVAVPASKGDAERSKAWLSVCDALDRVCPDWMDANGKTGTELAVAAIERLAARQPAALAVPAASVTPMRQPRADLARLVGSINAAVYANGDGLSVTEAIGALELAKLELLKEQEQ